MNKEEFLKGMNDLKGITTNDIESLVDASINHPYCQNLHLLIAKKFHDNNHPKASAKLHTAAIYAPDRHLLKKLIEDDPSYISAKRNFHEKYRESRFPETTSQSIIIEKVVEVPTEPSSNKVTATNNVDSNPVVVTFPKLIISLSFIDLINNSIVLNNAEEKEQQNSEVSENNIYDDLEKTLQEYKKRKNEATPSENHQEDSLIRKSESKDEQGDIPLSKEDGEFQDPNSVVAAKKESIDEINKNEAEEKDLADLKFIEQSQIIENFIKSNPTLSRFDLKFDEDQPTVEDLSIPKLTIGEHLISENLAVILHKQGKVKKAVDIYEKLILKFPEKKAYFTSCIENIKNSK
ncbi:tetratricopeptide repeat protein [soil metagenome]